ncbi:MAG: hypothetical protein ACF8Q5_15110 [Phycisphaerales bacterium JB040]
MRLTHTGAWAVFWLSLIACSASCGRADPDTQGDDVQPLRERIQPERLVARLDDRGLPEVLIDGVPAISASWIFWGKDWQYANAQVNAEPDPDHPGEFAVWNVVPDLGVHIAARVERDAGFVYDVTLTTDRAFGEAIGGGIEFGIDLDTFPGTMKPVLLPDNTGWAWAITDSKDVRFEVEPGLANAYFERGDRGRIRCFLLADAWEEGEQKLTFRLSLPDGVTLQKSDAERYAKPDASWIPDPLVWDAWPIDLSERLDAPAGSRGRVRADGEDLVYADGTQARFWGVNVQAYALFSGTDADIERQADRIAALGFNLVRIHHADSRWVQPNLFGDDGVGGDFSEAMARRMDRWIAALQARGVHVWLDLHVGRFLAESELTEDEGIREILENGGSIKGYNYANPAIEAKMESFASWVLERENSVTGVRYADDPTIVAVLLTNENDLTTHFGNRMLADKNVPIHHRLFRGEIREIALAMGLNPDTAMRTWEPGPSQLAMAELERRFFERHIAHVRATGYDGLIATTNFWGGMRISGLASLTLGDVIDVHSYGEGGELSINPNTGATWLSRVAQAHVLGMPLTITEWNLPHPTRDRFTAPIHMAATAAFQGWDAPMLYGYLQEPLEAPKRAREWSAWVDPALMALMPAASVLYLDGHVQQGDSRTLFTPDRQETYFRDASADTYPALRAHFESSRFNVQLPDTSELDFDDAPDTPAGVRTIADPGEGMAPGASANAVSTQDGSITRDWQRGLLTIDTPKSSVVSGWLEGSISLGQAEFEIATPAATVALTALDDRPIAESERVLLSAVAQAAPGYEANLQRSVWAGEPVRGTVRIPGRGSSLRVRGLDGRGRTVSERVVAPDEGGVVRIELNPEGEPATLWFLLEPAEPPANP